MICCLLFILSVCQDLDAAAVGRNWTVLATLGGLALCALLLALLGHQWDRRERRTIASKLVASHTALSRDVLANPTQRNRNELAKKKELAAYSIPLRRRRRLEEGRADPTRLLEDSLPQVLQLRKRLMHRVAHELAQHHRWLAVMTRYSETFPRSLRVLSLATNIIVMLFLQALVYSLSNPDDGTCASLTSQAACLRPRADFSGGGVGKCSWKPQGGGTGGGKGECSFAEPSDAMLVVLFVALFSAVVSAPIAVFLHSIIQETLAAPLVAVDSSLLPSASPGELKKASLLESVLAGAGGALREKEQREEDDRQASEQLLSLQLALQKHRDTLSSEGRREFNGTLTHIRRLLCTF